MSYFRVRLDLAGATGGSNPWQADTIFGHLCWALRYAEGEGELLRFLAAYGEGEPPVLVSNGFPGDLLPRPLHLEHLRTGSTDNPQQREEFFSHYRELRKRQYLTLEEFQGARVGRLPDSDSDPPGIAHTRVTMKNQINRLTNTTSDGGQLFGFEETFIPQVTVYCGVAEGYEARAEGLFRIMAASGYGKRKAVGYGAIRHLEWRPLSTPSPTTGVGALLAAPLQDEWFADIPGANAVVSLSNFVPARKDPTQGWWKTLVKYGRLGEEFASSEHPFKRPVIMLQAGTVLLDPAPRAYYGRLVRDVSFLDPGIVQYGYALAVPLRVPAAFGGEL